MDGKPSESFFFLVACKSQSLVAVARFLPGRARDLPASRYSILCKRHIILCLIPRNCTNGNKYTLYCTISSQFRVVYRAVNTFLSTQGLDLLMTEYHYRRLDAKCASMKIYSNRRTNRLKLRSFSSNFSCCIQHQIHVFKSLFAPCIVVQCVI